MSGKSLTDKQQAEKWERAWAAKCEELKQAQKDYAEMVKQRDQFQRHMGYYWRIVGVLTIALEDAQTTEQERKK